MVLSLPTLLKGLPYEFARARERDYSASAGGPHAYLWMAARQYDPQISEVTGR